MKGFFVQAPSGARSGLNPTGQEGSSRVLHMCAGSRTFKDTKLHGNMIPLHHVKEGNWIRVQNEGQDLEVEVTQVSYERIAVGIKGKEIWYDPDQVHPIPFTESWLERFHFVRTNDPEILRGADRAYTHGPFRVRFLKAGSDKDLELECHGEHNRDFHHGLMVHEFQNHYHGMTKVFIA